MKREKQLLLDEMKEQMKRSDSFIVAQYQQMTGARAHAFRRDLAKVGGHFEVVRKRMLLQAAHQLGVEFDAAAFPGHIGIVLGAQDPLQAAKVVLQFSQANSSALQLMGGYFEGKKISAQDVQYMASLPSKEQLRAEFLSLLEAPAAQLLAVMEALLKSKVSCDDQQIKNDE